MLTQFKKTAVILGLMMTAGCSPGIFGSSGPDKTVQQLPSYRRVNTSCAGLDLSKDRFNVASFRALVNCFNDEGAIPEAANFVNHTDPKLLEPVIRLINDELLGNPGLLFGLERTFHDLDDRGQLNSALKNVARLLSHDDLITSALVLWRQKTWTDVVSLSSGPTRTELLKAIEILGSRIDDASGEQLLDSANWLVTGKSFRELSDRLAQSGTVTIGAASNGLASYLKGAQDGDRARVLKQTIEVAWTGELIHSLDPVIGTDEARMRFQVPKISALFDSFFENQGALAHELGSLIHSLNDPISCLKGAAKVEKPTNLILSDLAGIKASNDQQLADRAAEYLIRTDPLRLMALSPLCTFPQGLNEHKMKVDELLVSSKALVPLVETLRGLYAIRRDGRYPMVEFFVDLLSEGGFDDLLPAFNGLSERHAWDDIVLVANRIPIERRATSDRAAYAYLTEPRAELGGKSVSQVIAGAASQLSVRKIADFLQSGLALLQKSDADLVPAIASMRAVFRVNDTRPFVDLGRNVLSHATRYEELFDAIYQLAAESAEFRAALRAVPRLAEGGQLRDVLGTTIALFHNRATDGSRLVGLGALSAEVPARHDLDAASLVPFQAPVVSDQGALLAKCSKFDFTFSMDQYKSSKFQEQSQLFIACLRSDPSNQSGNDTATAMEYLLNEKVEDGRSFYGYTMDLLRSWGDQLEPSQLAWLLDSWTNQYDDGRLQQALSACHFWVGDHGSENQVLRPLIEALAENFSKMRAPLQRVEKLAGRVLKLDEVAPALGYVEDLADKKLAPLPKLNPSPRMDTDGEKTARWVSNKECEGPADGSATPQKRAERLMEEYHNAVNGWELVGGTPRMQWPIQDLRAAVEPMFKKLAEPSFREGQKHVLDALLKGVGYFSREATDAADRDHQFPADYLERWLRERSNDYKRITYYYPGETKPRVKFVNSIDRLELLVVNADINGPFYKMDLYYLALIAEAWGDEDPSVWPTEIQQKYNETGEYPKKLSEVVQQMWSDVTGFESALGSPPIPGCVSRDATDPEDVEIPKIAPGDIPIPGFDPKPFRIALYNLHQVLSVLTENAPGSGTPFDGGLKVLRNLFFELYYSTNPDVRMPSAGDANNLSLITRLTRLGVLREIGSVLRSTSQGDPATKEFYLSFLKAIRSPEISKLLLPLIVEDADHALIWKLVERIYAQLDESPEARARVKQVAFYGMTVAREMGIIDGFLRNVGEALHERGDFLLKHADVLDDLLSSENVRQVLRAYFEDGTNPLKLKFKAVTDAALGEPGLVTDTLNAIQPMIESPKWDLFKARRDALQANPAYKALDFKGIKRGLLDLIEERSTDPQGVLFDKKTRLFVAEQLESGEFDKLLWMAAQKSKDNPDGFYHLLETFASAAGTQEKPGDLMDFFGFIRRGLPR